MSRFFLSANFRFPILFVIITWSAPALLYYFSPFSVGLKVDVVLFLLVFILIVFVSVLPAFILGAKSYVYSRDLIFSRLGMVSFLLSCLGLILQVVEFIYFRDVQFSLDLNKNREVFSEGGSWLTFLIVILLPFSYINFNIFFEKKKIIFLLPFLMSSFMFFLSGNRQFFIFGVFLLTVYYFMINPSISLKKAVVSFFIGFILVSLLFFIQFKRQVYAEGEQLNFIYGIANMECNGSACDTFIETPFAYLYLYFGLQYAGLSSVHELVDLDQNFTAPLFSQTNPFLYRRLGAFFSLPSKEEIDLNLMEIFEGKVNMFPAFWTTMFSGFMIEIGILGLFVLPLFFLCFGFFVFLLFIGHLTSFSFFSIAVFYSFLIFGVMYFPISEPVFFMLFLYLIVYGFMVSLFRVLSAGRVVR